MTTAVEESGAAVAVIGPTPGAAPAVDVPSGVTGSDAADSTTEPDDHENGRDPSIGDDGEAQSLDSTASTGDGATRASASLSAIMSMRDLRCGDEVCTAASISKPEATRATGR